MKLKHLQEKKEAKKAELRGFLSKAEEEGRVLTAEEMQTVENGKKEIAELNSQLNLVDDLDLEEEKSKLSAAGKTFSGGGSQERKKSSADKGDFETMEAWLETVVSNPNDERLEYRDYRADQNTGSGASGGFAIPKQFRPLLQMVDPAQALVRPRANVIPAGDPPDAEIVIPALDQQPLNGLNQVYGGVTVAKVAEGGLKPTTNFKLREISLKPHEIAAMLPLTDKLLRNWKASATWASDLLRKAVAGFEDTQFIRGDGMGGPLGATLAPAAYVVTRQTALTVTLRDLKDMYVRFRGDETKALWIVSNAVMRALLDIVGDGGGATNIIAVDRATGNVTIYGIPVKKHPRMAAIGNRGDIALCDFSEYVIKDGSGPIVEVGYAAGQWERNTRSIKITFNVDGKPWLTAPYRDVDDYEVSPFVVLSTLLS